MKIILALDDLEYAGGASPGIQLARGGRRFLTLPE
jgi:hypothetical protein